MNGMEIFNELCIYATCILFYLFTDYLDNPIYKWNIGWAQIAIVGLNFVVNIIYIIIQMVHIIRQRFCNKFRRMKVRI
jgi:hypothetical protein